MTKKLCRECGKPIKIRVGQTVWSYRCTHFHPQCYEISRVRDARERNLKRNAEQRALTPIDIGAAALVVSRAIKRVYGDVYDDDFPRRFYEVEKKFATENGDTQ